MRIAPIESQSLGHFHDDPQVLPRVPRQLQRLPPQLHRAIGIGERAGFFRKCRCGQNDVRQIAGFCEEDILHDEHVELGQCLAGMLYVRVGHRWVFAHDVHAADLPSIHGVHDLHHGEPWFWIERFPPQRLEALLHVDIVDPLVVGIHHRNQADVACALHVILATQWVQAGAGSADLASDQGQRDQAARVVGAVNMLRNAHAPQDHRAARAGVQPCHCANGRRRYAAYRRHGFRAITSNIVLQFLVAMRAVCHKALGHQAFLDDRVQHGV